MATPRGGARIPLAVLRAGLQLGCGDTDVRKVACCLVHVACHASGGGAYPYGYSRHGENVVRCRRHERKGGHEVVVRGEIAGGQCPLLSIHV
ncbi:hypothetical protein C8T65DRAFT_95648 [Cerioporus squamosus]|nr:hypothetical protein C8T65DRAFT_95648 [Cerioporus squamosus]